MHQITPQVNLGFSPAPSPALPAPPHPFGSALPARPALRPAGPTRGPPRPTCLVPVDLQPGGPADVLRGVHSCRTPTPRPEVSAAHRSAALGRRAGPALGVRATRGLAGWAPGAPGGSVPRGRGPDRRVGDARGGRAPAGSGGRAREGGAAGKVRRAWRGPRFARGPGTALRHDPRARLLVCGRPSDTPQEGGTGPEGW